jgi:hypothetical protein
MLMTDKESIIRLTLIIEVSPLSHSGGKGDGFSDKGGGEESFRSAAYEGGRVGRKRTVKSGVGQEAAK